MRPILLALAILVATSAAGARADLNYPWCAQYGGGRGGGGRNCGFSTYEQCMTTILGMGGFCEQNTTYVPSSPASRSSRKHHYHYSRQY